jgi:tetratricopeptide (TPR) repeat protein
LEFSKKETYIKQIALYLSNASYSQAYELSKSFVAKFPDELISHFLLAKSAYWSGDYAEAKLEARKSFNIAKSPEDLLTCAVIASAAYYRLGEYSKGLEMLKAVEGMKRTAELEQLLFIFSVAVENEDEAMKHIRELQRLDKKIALEFIKKYVGERA